jgi:hypothetical protein
MLVGLEFIKSTNPEAFQDPNSKARSIVEGRFSSSPGSTKCHSWTSMFLDKGFENGTPVRVGLTCISYRAFAAHNFSVTPRIGLPGPRIVSNHVIDVQFHPSRATCYPCPGRENRRLPHLLETAKPCNHGACIRDPSHGRGIRNQCLTADVAAASPTQGHNNRNGSP